MSLDKVIEHQKEKRRQYRGCMSADRSCSNQGRCEWCMGNREYSHRKRDESMRCKLNEYYREINLNTVDI